MAYLSNAIRYEGDPRLLRSGRSAISTADRIGRALGWFSIGLGVAELIAPGRITRALGLDGKETLVRAYGAREIGAGILSLSTEKDAGLWSRVAGDVIDIATLAQALRSDNPKRGNAGMALALVAGITLVDALAAKGVATRHRRSGGDRGRYRDRSGFPQGVQSARGAARDFKAPSDMRATPVVMLQPNRSAAG
jgi:hypothetical protein